MSRLTRRLGQVSGNRPAITVLLMNGGPLRSEPSEGILYLNNGGLAFHGNLYFRSSQDDVEMSTFDVGCDGGRDVDVADRLDPFVG